MGKTGVALFKQLSDRIFELVTDADLEALYPTIKSVINIFQTTLIGKIYKRDNLEDLDYSSKLIDLTVSRNPMAIGSSLLHLPNESELIDILDKIVNETLKLGDKHGST